MTVSLKELIKHIDSCPIGWHDGHIIAHRSVTEAEMVTWLKKLHELNKYVKEQEVKLLDVRNSEKKSITRTM